MIDVTGGWLAIADRVGHDRDMRVVIAGSSGLIGSALVATLRGASHDVVRLVRRAPAGADERRWDPPAGSIEPGALEGADAVINLCGVAIAGRRWTEERKQAIRDSRNTPTEVLAAAVAEHGIGTLINASAVGFYGDTGDREIDETAPAGAGFLASVCQEWERSTSAAAQAGSRVVLLRSGLVLARNGGALGLIKPVFSFYLGGRLGSGQQYMPWIALDDHVAAIRFVAEHDTLTGPVNLTGPRPVTNLEFTDAMAHATGRPAPWVVPGFALRMVVGGFADEGVLVGQNAVPRALLRAGFTFRHETVRDALTTVV